MKLERNSHRVDATGIAPSFFLNHSALLTHVDTIKKFSDILVLDMTFLYKREHVRARTQFQ
jgi:hypothetical protein